MEVNEPPISDYGQLDLSQTYTYLQYYNWKIKERIELIKGKIFKMSPAPDVVHQKISARLHILMNNYFENHSCELYYAPIDVRLPIPKKENPDTVVQPDLSVICDATELDEKGCNGVPDLIVEILSKGNSNHDLKTKFDLYEEVGLPEYWILNPWDKTIFIYSLQNGKYIGSKPYVEDDTFAQSVLFPDFSVCLGEVFKGVE